MIAFDLRPVQPCLANRNEMAEGGLQASVRNDRMHLQPAIARRKAEGGIASARGGLGLRGR
jgi:hypothetical protein